MAIVKSSPPNNAHPESAALLHGTQHTTLARPELGQTHRNVINGSVYVVVQRPHNRFFLQLLSLKASTTSRDVIQELRVIQNQEVSRIKIMKHIRKTLWTTVIEMAHLSTVSDLSSLDLKLRC